MKVQAVDPISGMVTEFELKKLKFEEEEGINKLDISDIETNKIISNLNISADAKSMLKKLSSITIKAGQKILRVGRRMLDIVIGLFKNYPNTGFGMLLGVFIGIIISTIPIIGILIGSLITPLATAFGFIVGVSEDLKNKALAREIAKATKVFQPLAE